MSRTLQWEATALEAIVDGVYVSVMRVSPIWEWSVERMDDDAGDKGRAMTRSLAISRATTAALLLRRPKPKRARGGR